jgi:hypothetical protein
MNKPISKHALRRALERVRKEGLINWEQPTGPVVDRIWHEIEKKAHSPGRKKATSRETVRTAPLPPVLEE